MTAIEFDLEPAFRDAYARCAPETMTSKERMYALWSAVRYLEASGLSGDIVECGVWRGGSMMMAVEALASVGTAMVRDLWLYDTYAGMPPPEDVDVQAMTGEGATGILAEQPRTEDNPFWAIAQRDIVERNLVASGYPVERMHFVEGLVEDTIPAEAPERIALLRLDTDWYASTRHELEHLWPRLIPGGVLIIDDYGYWQGARQAVDEFFGALPDAPLLNRIDFTGRLAVKR